MDAIYNGSNSFRVFDNRVAEFSEGRRVKMDCGLDGVKYASVVFASYSAPYTTVQIDESDLTASLTDVWYAIVTAGSEGSIPDHLHNTSEGSGGKIDAGSTFIDLNDTPTTYSGSEGLYLRVDSTASGVEFAEAITTFLDLTDTPSTYSGSEDLYLRVTTTGINFSYLSTSGTDDHSHMAYVPWTFGSGTISGTGDIYCNDIYTSEGTVWIGDAQISAVNGNLLINNTNLNGLTSFQGLGNVDNLPQFINNTTYQSSGVFDFSIDRPAGTDTGDVMLASMMVGVNQVHNGNDHVDSIPAGWTEIVSNSLNTDGRLHVYYKYISNILLEGSNYAWSLDLSCAVAASIMTFRYIDSDNPIGAISVSIGNSTSITASAITTSTNNAIVVHTLGHMYNTSITPPTEFVEVYKLVAGGGVAAAQMLSETSFKSLDTSGNTGDLVAIAGNSDRWAVAAIELQPFQAGQIKTTMTINTDGAVSLSYNGYTAATTTSTSGIDVVNEVTAVTYYGDGSSLTGITVSGTLLQNGSTPLTGDWNYDTYTISGTGDIHCNDIYTSEGTVYVGDANISAVDGNLLVKTNTIGSVMQFKGTGNVRNQPAHVATATSINSNTTSLTIVKPTGVTDGDLLVCQFGYEYGLGGDMVNSVPSGWALLYSVRHNTYCRAFLYYKMATGSEPVNYIWGFSASSNIDCHGAIAAFRYVDPDNPIGNTSYGANSAASLETVYDNEIVWCMGSHRWGEDRNPPSGFTEIYDLRNGSGEYNLSIEGSYRSYPTLGFTGILATDPSSSFTGAVALRPIISSQSRSLLNLDSSGPTEIFHDGYTAAITTSTTGINVTNEVTAVTYYGDGSNLTGVAAGGGGSTTLSGLTDTPSGYDVGKYLISTASGTEWATVFSGVQTLLGLTDTPVTYDEGKFLYSKANGTKWVDVPAGTLWLNGEGTPSEALGVANNYYLDTISGSVHSKTVLIYGSDECNGGTPGGSEWVSTYVPANAFNNNLNYTTRWSTDSSPSYPVWLGYQFAAQKQIQKIRMYPANDVKSPKDFTFRASNTGAFSGEETILLTLAGETFTEFVWNEYEFTNDEEYLYYRIYITAINPGGGECHLSEVEMLELSSANWELIYTPTTASGSETVSGTLLQDGSTPLTGDWGYGINTISGTGDIYCNDIYTSSGTVYLGELRLSSDGDNLLVDGTVVSGTDGADGVDGVDGDDGTVWYSGTDAPPGQILGQPNDFYLNNSTYDLYKKDDGSHSLINSLVGGTPTASSFGAGYEPTKAVDGNPSTSWRSITGGTQWWQYDLGVGNEKVLSKFTLTDLLWFENHKIEGSNNGSAWTSLYTGTALSNGTHDMVFSNFNSYRYYKLTNYGSASRTEVHEIEGYTYDSFDWQLNGNIKGDDGADGADGVDGNDAPTTFSGLTDTPDDYGTEGQYLTSTGSGIDFIVLSPAPAEGNWVLVREINVDNETFSESIPWDGDEWPRARIETSIISGTTAAADLKLRFNNDSTTDIYTSGYIIQNGGVTQASSSNNDFMYFGLGSGLTTRNYFATTDLYLKSGGRRFARCHDTIYDSGDLDRVLGDYDNYWNNTSSNVTSIDISATTACTGTFKVYRWRDITDIPVNKGKQSLQVEYATASGIYINPGDIHMKDSYYGMYALADRLEVSFDSLAADTWYYVYTNVSGSIASLDETNFTVSSGVPTIDYPNMGYYNGNERCIGAVHTDVSNDIEIFDRGPGGYNAWYQNRVTNISNTNIGTSGAPNTINFAYTPAFSTMINVMFATGTYDGSNNTSMYFGKSSSTGVVGCYFHTAGRAQRNERVIFCTGGQSGVVWESGASSNTFVVYENGFYLPDYIYTGA
jgi:hypothetical protein